MDGPADCPLKAGASAREETAEEKGRRGDGGGFRGGFARASDLVCIHKSRRYTAHAPENTQIP